MFEFLRQLVTGISDAWRRLSVNARVQIALSAVLTFALLGGAVYMGAQPQFAQAYNGLDTEESAEIVIWLEDQGIPYRLRDGGRTIDVPTNRISSARVALAGQGIPRSQGVVPGFEIFNERSLMTNEFLQDVDYARAVNGELQRQLNMFDFVRGSSVFIREAPERLFTSQQEPTEAAVTLDLVGGALLESQKKAVLHTISTFGGANLSANNITITTTKGELIHSPIEDQFAAMASSHLEARVKWEAQRAEAVESMFRGMGRKAIVRVSANLDWSTEEKQATELGEKVPISLMETTLQSNSSEGRAEGAPGAIANVPESTENDSSTTTTTESELVTNYEIPRTIVSTKQEPGRVEKFLVTAFIEGDYTTPAEGEGEPTYVPLSDEKIEEFSTAIANAVGHGIDTTDVIVIDQPFKVAAAAAMTVPATAAIMQNPQLWQAVQILLIIMAFFALRVLIRRAMVLPTAEVEEVIEMPSMSAEEQHRQDVAAEVERLSQEEPETVAALLRTWIAEDDV